MIDFIAKTWIHLRTWQTSHKNRHGELELSYGARLVLNEMQVAQPVHQEPKTR